MESTQPTATSKKILVIEDEPFISELYMRALSTSGYDAKVVTDGEVALKEAQSNAYNIILLDIMIPNLMGTEILKRLRDPKQTPNLKAKVIITTNLEFAENDRAVIERQADGFIVKADITPKELVVFLDQLQLNN
jgi:DNA-binding response OmpR family regulator